MPWPNYLGAKEPHMYLSTQTRREKKKGIPEANQISTRTKGIDYSDTISNVGDIFLSYSRLCQKK